MKTKYSIHRFIKAVFYLPINILTIMINVKRIENKILLLNEKIDELLLNFNLEKEESIQSSQEHNNSQSSILLKMNEILENHFLQIESLFSIYNSLPNLKYLTATKGWAGSPDFLNKIIEIIIKQKPNFVLEASSGVSSVVIGLALKMNNYGKVISLEHDESFAEKTRSNIEVNDIKDISTVINCPINDCLIEEEIWKWYETEELSFIDKIDLLIIDGPPRTIQKLARYPAIPILYKHFSDNVVILLDDTKRLDETIIIEKWINFLENKGFNVNVERYSNYEKGMVILNVQKE